MPIAASSGRKAPEAVASWLKQLLQKLPPLKNFRDLKRLRVLAAIAEGGTSTKTAEVTGMSSQGVRNLGREIAAKGWDELLREIESRIVARTKKRDASALAKRGRPPLADLEEFEKIQKPQLEDVVALAAISVSARAQIALFAVRIARGASEPDDPNLAQLTRHERLVSSVNKFLTSTEENFPRDTLDPLCGPLVEALLYLGEKLELHRHTCNASPLPPCATEFSEVVSQDPPKGWHFFSLEAGEAEALSGLKKRVVGQRNCTVIQCDSAEFVRRVLGAIVSLRLRLPIVGLLPMDQLEFLKLVHGWNPKQAPAGFEWLWDVKSVHRVLRRRLAENCAYAAFGFLVRLPSRCRTRLCFSDTFPVDTLTLRPGVAVSPGDLEGIEGAIVTYSPIPQTPVSEHFVFYKGNCPALESTIREQLRKSPNSGRFEYCVRPSKEQRRAMTLPIEVLEKAKVTVYRPPGQPAYLKAAIVSVPLHFAMNPPAISLDQLLTCGEQLLKAKKVADTVEEDDEQLLVFCFPPILEAIIKAFRRNAYGDRLAFLGLAQKQLQRKWKGAELSGEFLAGGKRRFAPQFYFTEKELAAKNASEVTELRLSHCTIPARALSANGLVQDRETHRYPGYTESRALRNTLLGLDADFMLREISERHWTSLAAAANEWENLYRETYLAWLSESHKHPEVLRNLLAAQCRDAWKGKEDELRDWAMKTVDLSKKQAIRVLRNAVENAQRLMLSGRKPLAVVVRKRSELIYLWKAHLRIILTARTIERFNLDLQLTQEAKLSMPVHSDGGDKEEDFGPEGDIAQEGDIGQEADIEQEAD